MPRSQRILLLVLGLAFFALAAAALARGFPWYIAILWAASGVVMVLLFRKAGQRSPARPTPSADPATRARRSGNPAVRAAQQERDTPRPEQ